MASMILTQQAQVAPPVDSVAVSLTPLIQRDLAQRGVFTELREAQPREVRYGRALHYVSPALAAELLSDATQHQCAASRGLLTAYKSHALNLKFAIEEASKRVACFQASESVQLWANDWCEEWRGTKEQLIAKGIRPKSGWPDDPEADGRCKYATDWRGFRTKLASFSKVWPGLYVATIRIPEARRESTKSEIRGRAARAKDALAGMPANADEYRCEVVDILRTSLMSMVAVFSGPVPRHAFALHPDSLDAIGASFDAVAEAIASARVVFDASHHEEIVRGFRAAIADADPVFQARKAALLAPVRRSHQGASQ